MTVWFDCRPVILCVTIHMYSYIHDSAAIREDTKAMDLLQLRYFQTVARLEHMTQAAQELYISQSSLSKTIIHLEHELGVSLFDRQGRKIQLNQYGKAFLRRVEQVFAALDDGQRELADLAEGKQGQVSLASMSIYLLPVFSSPSVSAIQASTSAFLALLVRKCSLSLNAEKLIFASLPRRSNGQRSSIHH